MRLLNITMFILLSISTNMAQRTFLDNFTHVSRFLGGILSSFYEKEEATPYYQLQLDASQRKQIVNNSVAFPCSIKNGRSKHKPTSVHKLKIGDIDVIGALGDSLTVGLGAFSTNMFNLAREYKGVSFAIGGEKSWREYFTLPNMIKEYNPNLIGYSLASAPSTDKRTQFNAAETGAISADIYYMAKVLIKRLQSDKRVNITSDWKFISLCIGGNDFCSWMCYYKNSSVVLEKHKRDLIRTFRLLRDKLPRTFINFIPPPNVLLLKQFVSKPSDCEVTLRFSCPCIIGERFKSFASTFAADFINKWKEIDIEVSNYEEFNRNDFTIEIQPVFKDLILPKTSNNKVDYTNFAVDCFHFSQKGHAMVAQALWNNLFSCAKKKQTTVLSDSIKCPDSENPYISTKNNKLVCN